MCLSLEDRISNNEPIYMFTPQVKDKISAENAEQGEEELNRTDKNPKSECDI